MQVDFRTFTPPLRSDSAKVITMSTTGKPEPAPPLDEHKPSWITVGRSNVRGICADLIATVGQLVQVLALTVVVLPARDSQPETVLGKLRGKTLDTIPMPDCGILEAASSSAGTPVRDAIEQSLAAESAAGCCQDHPPGHPRGADRASDRRMGFSTGLPHIPRPATWPSSAVSVSRPPSPSPT